jgi:tritrans,polycis-undecaprenyl-diphosphate synthase [geranylgeranyl-diphosphate specific]
MKHKLFKSMSYNERMTESSVPKHIGIILDGNRRFSRKLMMKPWKGHEWGAGKVEKLFDWVQELGVKELTLYAFSYENFNRPKEEFDHLMRIFKNEFDKAMKDDRIHNNRIRINIIGRIHMFPEDVRASLQKIMDATKGYGDYIINFAMAYGGRTEVIDATRKISQRIKDGTLDIDDINEKTFQECLYMEDEPDLIIRTGGAHRTSNFLVWQSIYSEWVFLEKTWPEFEKEDLIQAIGDFVSRERRFGR